MSGAALRHINMAEWMVLRIGFEITYFVPSMARGIRKEFLEDCIDLSSSFHQHFPQLPPIALSHSIPHPAFHMLLSLSDPACFFFEAMFFIECL
jgi:hypothetical protein